MNKLENSKGDTIVEVLMALVILTTIMVGAYATANRAQNSSQASQERAEANKIAESQIERLKGMLAKTTPPTLPSVPFCVKSDNSGYDPFPAGTDPFTTSLELDTLPYTPPASCGNIDGRYNVAVKASSNTFSFIVRWERVAGGRDQINMYYRVH